MDTLEDTKKNAEYSCSDPRLHPRVREDVNQFARIATERHQGDFEPLHGLINDYIKDHHCVILHSFCDYISIVGHEIFFGLDFLRQNTWTGNISIEVQKVSPVCFGIWVVGIERLTANAHCLNIWRNSDHISDLISTPNTNRLGTNHCITITLSLPSRTSLLTYF